MAVVTHGSARLVAVAMLTLVASRAPAVALREAGNDILTIRVSDQPANIGLFTVGSSTMIAPPDGQNLFFDFKGKKVNTSFVTVRDGTTLWVSANASSDSEKPVMAAPAGMSGSLYTLQFMTTWPPAPTMSLIGSNGFVTSYILPGLTVLVEVEVVGSVLADSSVRQTVRVASTNGLPHDVGVRMLWDWMVDDNDAAFFRTRDPDGAWTRTFTGYAAPYPFARYEMTNSDITQDFSIFGTIEAPSMAVPPTKPDRLLYAGWNNARSAAWTFSNTGGGVDSAIVYFWEQATVNPGAPAAFTQYVSTVIDALRSPHLILDYRVSNTGFVCGGDALTYTIGIRNDGDATAQNITITSTLPDSLMYLPGSVALWTPPDGLGTPVISASAYGTSQGGPWTPGMPPANAVFGAPQLLRWVVNRLAPGHSALLVFIGNVAPANLVAPVPVKSSVSATELLDTRLYRAGEVSSINEWVHLSLDAVNLAGNVQWLDKDPVRYTITVRTACESPVYNLRIFDTVPPGAKLTAPVTPGATVTSGTMLLWTIPTLTQGQSAAFVFDTVISCATVFINNAAAVDYDGRKNGLPFPENRVYSNNTKLDTTCPKLQFNKLLQNNTYHAPRGGLVTFTLDVLNQFNATLSNVRVWDSLPAGMSFVSATGGGVYNAAANRVDWIPFPDVGPVSDKFVTLTVSITATCSDPDKNKAQMTYTATGSQVPFPPQSTNEVLITLDRPNIVPTVMISPNPVPAFDVLQYDLYVSNEPNAALWGYERAEQITVWDSVPIGATLFAATDPPGASHVITGTAPQIVTWTLSPLGTYDVVKLGMTLKISEKFGQVCFDKPFASYTDPSQCVMYSASVEGGCATIAQPEINLWKRIVDSFVPVGGTAEFVFSMTNSGTDSALNVVVTDPITLLPNVAITSCSGPPGWTCTLNGATMTWSATGMSLNPGQEATLRFNAMVLSGTLEDCATSPSGGNNKGAVSYENRMGDLIAVFWSNTVCLRSSEAVLDMAKWADEATPAVGGSFRYYLSLTNSGGVACRNITVWDSLPPAVEFRLCEPPGSCNLVGGPPGMVVWTVPDLPPGAGILLNYKVSATEFPAFSCTNFAEAAYTNTVPTVRPRVQSNGVCLPIEQARIDVTASMSKVQYASGEPVTINLSFTNVGDGVHVIGKTGKISIVDTIDAGSSILSSQWALNGGGIPTPGFNDAFCPCVTLGPSPLLPLQGGWASITAVPPIPTCSGLPTMSRHDIVVTYDNGGGVVQPLATFSFTATIYSAGLSIFTMTPSTPVVRQGDLLTYRIDFANGCSDTLHNVTIWDSLPAGVAGAPGVLSWSLGTLPPGSTGSLFFTVTVTGLGPLIGPSSAVAAFDNSALLPQPYRLTPPFTVAVLTPHLTLDKTTPSPTATTSDVVTFTLSLRNAVANSDTAYNVSITDALPSPLKFVAATTGGVGSVSVSPGGDVVTWTRSAPGVGDVGLVPGEAWIVTVDARAPNGQADYVVTNTAAAAYTTPLGNPGLPTPSGPATVTLTARLKFKTYPNPFEPGNAVRGTMKFGGLPDGAKVHIYTLAGTTIADLTNMVQHTIEWDGRNATGTVVAAGIYLYAVELPDGKGGATWQRGKFGVIR